MAKSTSTRAYRPKVPFNVPMKLLIPTTTKVKGTKKKVYPNPDDKDVRLFYGSFRTFGGTLRVYDDVLTVDNTATIDTWYDPAFQSDARIYLCETGETYDIVSDPEDIDMRHQYMQFSVQKVGGKT